MAHMTRSLTEVCRVAVPGVYFEFDSDERFVQELEQLFPAVASKDPA